MGDGGYRPEKISIHTPAQGVTILSPMFPALMPISIHTPAQGVTGVQKAHPHRFRHFNPHSRTGSDNSSSVTSFSACDFNPHSRTGSDMVILHAIQWRLISIHTPAQGVTLQFYLSLPFFKISIHTPAQGVTFIHVNHSP